MNPKAATFRALHASADPLVLYNIWDAGSAVAVAKAGAKALATGSWSIAAANGLADGEKIDAELMLTTIARIALATDLPLTVDLESGYGSDPAAVGSTIARALAAGAIGCNLEDSFPATGALRDTAAQAERIGAARMAAADSGFFINARTDVFFQHPADQHDAGMADAAITRAHAYAAAGADGLFVPGLSDLALIARIVAASPLPVNVMRTGDTPTIADLARAGVARISHGPAPYLLAMAALGQAARGVYGTAGG